MEDPAIKSKLFRIAPAAFLILAAVAAWANSFGGPFLFDDGPSIADNPSIRRLWPLSTPLSPPGGGITVSGRPMLNFSFALNYAISGTRVWSYHLFNLAIHVLAGLTLLGIVRRTLAGRKFPGATAAAGCAALLWTVHPLQTESVTLMVQRAESLMGVFYLGTLYCFIRWVGCGDESLAASATGNTTRKRFVKSLWALLGLICCFCGMATKESMATAPLVVFLYDRTFIGGSFRRAWDRHRRFHLSLAAAWILLAWLVLHNWSRGATAGAGIGVGAGRYWLSQCPVIWRYLKLAVWPHPLVLDYGVEWAGGLARTFPAVLGVAVFVGGSVYLLWRRPALGFLAFWFLAILAPTSLIPGDRQTMAEHRMYLPLAAVVVGAVLALHRLPRLRLGLTGALVLLLAALTAARNRDYRDELTMWTKTVKERPGNPWAQGGLATACLTRGRAAEAVVHYKIALEHRDILSLRPGDLADMHYDLAVAYGSEGRLDPAVPEYRAALQIKPDLIEAHNNLGCIYALQGHPAEAIAQFQEVLRRDPGRADARRNLALAEQALWRSRGSSGSTSTR